MDINSTPMLYFWSHDANLSSGDEALFLEIIHLVSAFTSLPISYAAVV